MNWQVQIDLKAAIEEADTLKQKALLDYAFQRLTLEEMNLVFEVVENSLNRLHFNYIETNRIIDKASLIVKFDSLLN